MLKRFDYSTLEKINKIEKSFLTNGCSYSLIKKNLNNIGLSDDLNDYSYLKTYFNNYTLNQLTLAEELKVLNQENLVKIFYSMTTNQNIRFPDIIDLDNFASTYDITNFLKSGIKYEGLYIPKAISLNVFLGIESDEQKKQFIQAIIDFNYEEVERICVENQLYETHTISTENTYLVLFLKDKKLSNESVPMDFIDEKLSIIINELLLLKKEEIEELMYENNISDDFFQDFVIKTQRTIISALSLNHILHNNQVFRYVPDVLSVIMETINKYKEFDEGKNKSDIYCTLSFEDNLLVIEDSISQDKRLISIHEKMHIDDRILLIEYINDSFYDIIKTTEYQNNNVFLYNQLANFIPN